MLDYKTLYGRINFNVLLPIETSSYMIYLLDVYISKQMKMLIFSNNMWRKSSEIIQTKTTSNMLLITALAYLKMFFA